MEAVSVNHDTRMLMKIIGPPHGRAKSANDIGEDALLTFLPLAIENKIPLLFLERAVTLCKDSRSLKNLHQAYFEKMHAFLSLMEQVSKILVKSQTDYVVFKTFKPFPFVTVDVDILFFNHGEFLRVYRSLRRLYRLAGYGAHSISLYSPEHAMNIDIQQEISVSRLVYINKELLREYVTETDVNGRQVRVLESPAALVTVLAHSIYKEQILTLSDYYTAMIQLLNMTNRERRTFVVLAKQTRVEQGIKTALMLMNTLTAMTFGRAISAITETAQMIRRSKIEQKAIQLVLNNFAQNAKVPYKFHPIALGVAFATKILEDPVMRGTIPQQFVELITNTSELLNYMSLHMRRETY